MSTRTFSIFPFKKSDISKIDERLIPFTQGWKVIQKYKGKTVLIPGTWNSKITIVKYYQVVKQEGDPNTGEEENEIGLRIEAGWWPYDTEVIIELRISGYDVLDGLNKVSAEILKSGGAEMELYYKDKLITNFKSKGWFKKPIDKVWIEKL